MVSANATPPSSSTPSPMVAIISSDRRLMRRSPSPTSLGGGELTETISCPPRLANEGSIYTFRRDDICSSAERFLYLASCVEGDFCELRLTRVLRTSP